MGEKATMVRCNQRLLKATMVGRQSVYDEHVDDYQDHDDRGENPLFSLKSPTKFSNLLMSAFCDLLRLLNLSCCSFQLLSLMQHLGHGAVRNFLCFIRQSKRILQERCPLVLFPRCTVAHLLFVSLRTASAVSASQARHEGR